MKDIERKGDLKLLGVTLNEETCNWDTHLMHFDHLISKASPRLYILRVCKYYGYYLPRYDQSIKTDIGKPFDKSISIDNF